MIRKKRVVVAMSGGVDSSVAAIFLQRQGYEVIGLTMCFNLKAGQTPKPLCCGLEGIEDARRVAREAGIRHYVLDMQKELQRYVIEDFCQEYLYARTPNPCVRCNQYLKFNILLKKARVQEAEFLATGHYARIAQEGSISSKRYILKKGRDREKDQSYFLYRLTQKQLARTLFPIGGLFGVASLLNYL